MYISVSVIHCVKKQVPITFHPSRIFLSRLPKYRGTKNKLTGWDANEALASPWRGTQVGAVCIQYIMGQISNTVYGAK